MAKETLALRLTTLHNLHFMVALMRRMREAIINGDFANYQETFLADYRAVPEEKRGWRKR